MTRCRTSRSTTDCAPASAAAAAGTAMWRTSAPCRSAEPRRGPGDRASPYSWAAMIEPKDVVIAILGASAALAGFVLVFLGIVIAAYQSYSGGVPAPVVHPFRTAGTSLLGTFALCL